MHKNEYDIQIYTCPRCKKQFPNISNSAPHADGELCIQCITKTAAIEYEVDNK